MYKKRYIQFVEQLDISTWHIKAYTISENEIFKSNITYREAKNRLLQWLEDLNSFNGHHENNAFLILHEASEGVFILINTWVGNNMLQTHIYLSKYDSTNEFEKISGDGLFGCVWELEIINHEKNAWIKHILKNPISPNYKLYQEETLTVKF
jgi:hypothetical protein